MTLPMIATARRFPGEISEERGSLLLLPDGSARWRWADIGSDPQWDISMDAADCRSVDAAIDYAIDCGAHVERLTHPAAAEVEDPPSPWAAFTAGVLAALAAFISFLPQ